jgi:hypothetical protein
METSSVSVKPTLLPKTSPVSGAGKQSPQSTSPDKLAASKNAQATQGDTVSLSSESLQLAKSTNTPNTTQVQSIENRGQAQQVVQNIAERMRQQGTAALESQGVISGSKIKSLLAS